MFSGDVVVEHRELASVKKTIEDSEAGFGLVCAVEKSKFTYKGGPVNDDLSVWTCVFAKEGENWRMAHVARSTGRKWEEPTTELDSFFA